MWKRLEHPNIVPFLGVTVTPLQSVSTWMSGGDLLEYIDAHPSVDRLGFVGLRRATLNGAPTPLVRFLMSLMVSTTSIPTASSMEISKEFVWFRKRPPKRADRRFSQAFSWMKRDMRI